MFLGAKEYDAWKKKCALEKKEREAKRRSEIEVTRKWAYPFEEEEEDTKAAESVLPSSSTGTYVTLPTLPPVRVLVNMEKKTVIVPGVRQISEDAPSTSTTKPPSDCRLQRPLRPPPPSTIFPTDSFVFPNLSVAAMLANPSPPPSLPILPLPSTSSTSSILSTVPPLSTAPIPPTLTPFIQSLEICTALSAMPASLLLDRLEKGLPLFSFAQPLHSLPQPLHSFCSITLDPAKTFDPSNQNEFVNVQSYQSLCNSIDLTSSLNLSPPNLPSYQFSSPYFPFQIPLPTTARLDLSPEIQQLSKCIRQCITNSLR